MSHGPWPWVTWRLCMTFLVSFRHVWKFQIYVPSIGGNALYHPVITKCFLVLIIVQKRMKFHKDHKISSKFFLKYFQNFQYLLSFFVVIDKKISNLKMTKMTIIDVQWLQWDGDKHRPLLYITYYRTLFSCHPIWLASYRMEFISWLPLEYLK